MDYKESTKRKDGNFHLCPRCIALYKYSQFQKEIETLSNGQKSYRLKLPSKVNENATLNFSNHSCEYASLPYSYRKFARFAHRHSHKFTTHSEFLKSLYKRSFGLRLVPKNKIYTNLRNWYEDDCYIVIFS